MQDSLLRNRAENQSPGSALSSILMTKTRDQLFLHIYFSVKSGERNKIKMAQLTHTQKHGSGDGEGEVVSRWVRGPYYSSRSQ